MRNAWLPNLDAIIPRGTKAAERQDQRAAPSENVGLRMTKWAANVTAVIHVPGYTYERHGTAKWYEVRPPTCAPYDDDHLVDLQVMDDGRVELLEAFHATRCELARLKDSLAETFGLPDNGVITDVQTQSVPK